jgi:hypothetical protein
MNPMSENQIINKPEELDALPNFTVVVSAPAVVEGKTAVIAIQKLSDNWVPIGTPFPMTTDMISPKFYPGVVVYRLATPADTAGLG